VNVLLVSRVREIRTHGSTRGFKFINLEIYYMQKKTLKNLLTPKVIDINTKAFESYGIYKKTKEILDRANMAMGKKEAYVSTQCSTLNFDYKIHGIASTQKI